MVRSGPCRSERSDDALSRENMAIDHRYERYLWPVHVHWNGVVRTPEQ